MVLMSKYMVNRNETFKSRMEDTDYLEDIRKKLFIGIGLGCSPSLKPLIEDIWQQHLDVIQINKLVKNLRNGDLASNIEKWLHIYIEYFHLGFTYIV